MPQETTIWIVDVIGRYVSEQMIVMRKYAHRDCPLLFLVY
jgi:hypothetical protein